MTERIYGPQDPKLEQSESSPKCSECIDERLIKLANVIGYLVCPGCDLVVKA